MAENGCPNFRGLFTTKVIKSHAKLHLKSDVQRVNSIALLDNVRMDKTYISALVQSIECCERFETMSHFKNSLSLIVWVGIQTIKHKVAECSPE